MKLFEKKETKLQREMEKYMKKMNRLNHQLDNLNMEAKRKSLEFYMDNKGYKA